MWVIMEGESLCLSSAYIQRMSRPIHLLEPENNALMNRPVHTRVVLRSRWRRGGGGGSSFKVTSIKD